MPAKTPGLLQSLIRRQPGFPLKKRESIPHGKVAANFKRDLEYNRAATLRPICLKPAPAGISRPIVDKRKNKEVVCGERVTLAFALDLWCLCLY